MTDKQESAMASLVIGLILGGLVVWFIGLPGPNSGPKETPTKCEALEDDYWDMVELMLDVSPLSVQLRNRGGFNPTYVDVREGEGGILHVDDDAIEEEWEPMYDELTTRFDDDFLACREAFPDEF